MKSRRTIKKFLRRIKKPVLNKTSVVLLILCLVLIYGFANFFVHKHKTYPNFYLANNNFSSLSEDEVVSKANDLFSKPFIELTYDQQTEVKSARDLGIYFDEDRLRDSVNKKNFLNALKPWFIKTGQDFDFNVDQAKSQQALSIFKNKDFKPAKNATFTAEDGKLVVKKEQTGFGLDAKTISQEIADNLSVDFNKLSRRLEVSDIGADITKSDINKLSAQINDKLKNKYSIKAKGLVVTADKKQVASWLGVVKLQGEPTLKINQKKVKQYVKSTADRFNVDPINQVTNVYKSGKKSQTAVKGKNGQAAVNTDSIAENIIEALKSGSSYEGEFIFNKVDFKKTSEAIDDTIRTASYTYDVVVWGSIKSDINSFKALAAQTLADSRGWSSGGISFKEVPSGGNFTLVLAEPSRVGSASGICSSTYSCRVGRYVIINDDRWRLATPSWNSGGGSLRDYRHMVVNHETGHWLGFGHSYCSGSGQLAPVMQQQSISLQGCKFNPWPKASEISSL